MPPSIIPVVPGLRSSSRRILLSGREYRVDLQWSDFEGRFYLTLAAASGVVLVAAAAVVSNEPLLEGWHSIAGVPAGELVVMDTRPTPTDPGLEELGDVVRLSYWPPIEAEAASTTVTSPGGDPPGDPL